jgi:hypothetical protein
MATGFVNQFTTGRPYVMPTVDIAKPQVSINIPRLPDDPDPDPDPDPTEPKNPTENPQTKPISNPKTTGQNNSFWGRVGHDISVGAKDVGIGGGVLGAAGALGKGAYDLAKGGASDIGVNLPNSSQAADDVMDLGKGIFTRATTDVPEEISMGSKLINGADYNVVQPTENLVTQAAPKALGSWQSNLSSQFDDIMNNSLSDLKGAGSDLVNAGKATNSFLSKTSKGDSVEGLTNGKAATSDPFDFNFKSPDSFGNVADDLGDVLTGVDF